jgi:hypothetical protein
MVAKRKKAAGPVPKGKAMAEKREALLRALSPEGRRRVEWVGEWFSNADRSALQQRYELGVEVKGLYGEMATEASGRYGLRFIAGLCETFAWDRGVVYGALAVAEAFTPEQIAALTERPMANGRLVPFGHLVALAKVPARKTRESLLDRAITHGWTREDLQDAILKATTGKKKEDGRGRPLKPPRDLPGLLRQ